MRLFIAIPLSSEVKTTLKQLQQSLPEEVRRQPVEQMHITLRFLGETSSTATQTVRSQLARIDESAFSLSTTGTGVFPKKGRPKVVWAGVETVKPLMRLQEKIEKACVSSGFTPEKRTFTPHITIGKVKKASSNNMRKWIAQRENIKWAEVQADRFALYESRPKGGGVVHKAIKKFFI